MGSIFEFPPEVAGFKFKNFSIVFPPIFRKLSEFFEWPVYTLKPPGEGGIPIRNLDPNIDSGIIFVRHHDSLLSEQEYIDGIRTVKPYSVERYQDSHKYRFTLFLRYPLPGFMDRILVFEALIPLKNKIGLRQYIINDQGKFLQSDVLTKMSFLKK